tara:strand:- start:51 stop:1049 length:999 start_codon:yes stop_codon:yes gene_type:complete
MNKYGYNNIEFHNESVKKWWRPKIDKEILKELHKKRELPAILNTFIYFSLLIIFGYLAYLSWGTWYAIPAFLLYGTFYSFTNARWHEYGHKTFFKSKFLNNLFYEISSFLHYLESVSWRWSHHHHHSRTIHQGVDYEIQVTRPAKLFALFFLECFKCGLLWNEFKKIFLHSLGIMTPLALDCVPDNQRTAMIWNSRFLMFTKIFLISWAFYINSFLPLMFIFTPNIYGSIFLQFLVMTQHGGLRADSWDHRESTRTFYTNPILGWLCYLNMQYHIEHHIFPQIPFYNLPKLHNLIKDQMPKPNPNFLNALIEMIPAIIKQSKNPEYFIKKVF